MGTHVVTVMKGDGIGPEVVDATLLILEATGLSFVWDYQDIGLSALAGKGALLPKEAIDSVKRNRVGLKGPTGTPIGGGHRSINVTLRTKLDLYANVRPLRSMLGVPTLFSNVDLLIFRENTEDLYIGKERLLLRRGKRVAEAVSRITEAGSLRFARYAYAYARAHDRKKMTIGHKANILKKTHGLFLEVSRAVGSEFPDIVTEDLIADNLGMQLVRELGRNPSRFDCLLLPNFLGDIFSDFCAGFTGGLGLAPGANIGEEYAIFEAVHGTAPDIAGKGIANPESMVQAVLLAARLAH